MSILEIRNLSFGYRESPVLRDISLSLAEGDVLTLLGPNGSGKTTLLNCIIRFLEDYQGTILLNGTNTSKMTTKQMAEMVAYVPQMGQLSFDYTVKEFVVMGRCARMGLLAQPKNDDYRIVEDKLNIMGVSHLSERNLDELSGGERQLAYIARALVQEPKIILFDEPTSALDYGNQINTLRLISSLRNQGFAVVMTTHNPDHCMMLGGKVAILDKRGTLEVGQIDEVLNEEKLRHVYGTDLRMVFVEDAQRTVCIPAGLKD